ncbi:MAG: segregation and condensation protein A [Rhodopila sp.]
MSEIDPLMPEAGPPDPLWDDWETPPRVPSAPDLHLDGFDGPLDLLLDLVERERIDLSRISVAVMAEQFITAMTRFEKLVPLERRAGWVVLATRLVELRARLLFPATPEAAEAARRDAECELARLRALRFIKAATAWLEARPQSGQDVFIRPRRERDPRVASYMQLMEACLTLLEGEEEDAVGAAVYQPPARRLFSIPDALVRIRATLAALANPTPLIGFLPRLPMDVADRPLLARSAVSSTLLAALELARTAEVVLDDEDGFETVTLVAAGKDT